MSNEKTDIQIKEDTGEVIDNSTYSFGQGLSFRTMYCNPDPYKGIDLSNELEEVFEEVEPFALDTETGKLLNPTSQPMIISKGKINIQERIQSYAKECDIYSILERFAASGDSSLINVKQCQYGDISELPRDLNGYAQYVREHLQCLDEMNPDIAKMVIDKDIKPEDIEAKAKEILEERIKNSIDNVEKKEVNE